MEAAQRFLEAKERMPVGSEDWAVCTAMAFDKLRHKECAEVAKPEWWNDEALKALSMRVVRAAPNDEGANQMRAIVLSGLNDSAWEAGSRSVAELKEAATHYERTAALCPALVCKAELTRLAVLSRSQAEAKAIGARAAAAFRRATMSTTSDISATYMCMHMHMHMHMYMCMCMY